MGAGILLGGFKKLHFALEAVEEEVRKRRGGVCEEEEEEEHLYVS